MTPVLSGRPAARSLTPSDWLRQFAAQALHLASRALARRARSLAAPLHARRRRPVSAQAVIEFHADAGAPEGALYVDGEFIGYLDVDRL